LEAAPVALPPTAPGLAKSAKSEEGLLVVDVLVAAVVFAEAEEELTVVAAGVGVFVKPTKSSKSLSASVVTADVAALLLPPPPKDGPPPIERRSN